MDFAKVAWLVSGRTLNQVLSVWCPSVDVGGLGSLMIDLSRSVSFKQRGKKSKDQMGTNMDGHLITGKAGLETSQASLKLKCV